MFQIAEEGNVLTMVRILESFSVIRNLGLLKIILDLVDIEEVAHSFDTCREV